MVSFLKRHYFWAVKYSRTPEIEIANLTQCHVDFNLSQSQADGLFPISSSTATKNIWINTWHRNNIDKSNILVLDFTYDLHILLCHAFIFVNHECMTRQFKHHYNQFRALSACFTYFWLIYLSYNEINSKTEIEANWDRREIETNM